MDPSIKREIEEISGEKIIAVSPLSGGSIAASYRVSLNDGSSLFVKISPQYDDMFLKEAGGLHELLKAGALRVPAVIAATTEVLILEFLPVTSPESRKDFFDRFGKQFAALHRHSADHYGFFEDNYIGSTPQKNLPQSNSWKEFFLINRLEFQYRLAEKNGYAGKELHTLFLRLEKEIDRLVPDDGEPPSLLHGDLWSGNYLCTGNNIPAVIDPAVYFGHREADIAMTMLFGGFSETFYSSYNEAFPFTEDWERRMELYKLYHLLNHLNLFGEGYRGQVHSTLAFLVNS